MAASDNQSYSYKRYQPERLAITPVATGLVAWRWVAESMFSSKYTSRGISLPQPMGSGTDPGNWNGFGASMPADDGPGGGMDLSGRTHPQQHQRYQQWVYPSSTVLDERLFFSSQLIFFFQLKKEKIILPGYKEVL